MDAETASQSLEVNAVGTVVSWMRSGAAPELEQVTFEQSLDGTNYTLLGRGERMAGGWQLSGLTLPQTSVFLVRAGGRAVCGRNNGSSGRIGQTVEFYLFSPLRLVPSAGLRGDGSFEFQFTRLSGGAFTVLATTNVAAARPVWESLGPPNSLGNGVYQFSDRPVPGRPQRFYQIRSD